MVSHSKNGARTIEGAVVKVVVLAMLLVALPAVWSPAFASANRDAGCTLEGPGDAQCLAGSGDSQARRVIQPATEVAQKALHRPAGSTRIVLAPREVAARSTPGQLGADLSDAAPLAPALKVRAGWSDASEAEAQDNPFTLVGNRAGLVNVTQAEVRGGEVWLTAGARRREATQPGGFQTAAP